MRYDLPAHPPVTVVGPDDTRWWAHLGVEAAGRHAVVIGEPTTPDRAVIITGSVDAINAWLPDLRAAFDGVGRTLDAPAHRRGPRPGHAAPAQPDTDPLPTRLVTLPHTGLRVPDLDLRVTALRQLATHNGVAFTAQVAFAGATVGTVENDGNGGETFYRAVNSSPFNTRAMTRYARACRVHGRTPTEQFVLDALVAEFDNVTHVAQATRAGRTALRLVVPVNAGDGHDDVFTTVDLTTAPMVTSPEQRGALVADLLRQAPLYDGQRWQLWTGQRWEDLTPPAAEQPAGGA